MSKEIAVVGDADIFDPAIVKRILAQWRKEVHERPQIKDWLTIVVEVEPDKSAIVLLPWLDGIDCATKIAGEIGPDAVAAVENLAATAERGPRRMWWCKRAPGEFRIGCLRPTNLSPGGDA